MAVFRDPPDHTRLRRIMRHAFTAEAIEQMRPNIEDISQILLDRIDLNVANKLDLIGDFGRVCQLMSLWICRTCRET